MSSDDSYMAFLNKANADLNTSTAQSTSTFTPRTEAIHADVRVPAPLTSLTDAFYVSETDEPFEPVALKWQGAASGIWPDASHLSKLISPTKDLTSSIETLSPASFDPRNQYAGVLKAVRAAVAQAAGEGKVDEESVDLKVYRVEVGSSRVEYFVLGLDGVGGLVVGVRALAVES
ncbi:hypothetical protein BO71DRAFT_331694 [Aspergillus ellipticus CBS 707.79]|uniref:Uncharacterized protein n=1 Tax=Aspergillus ellipticus CBS 707.79 TaxID=1448320 RepID=A0A319D3E9_9EURO|nr:hypothetical protein BO71DRAFT_331694 [Aspergillus ellipticus CBS 707.79]